MAGGSLPPPDPFSNPPKKVRDNDGLHKRRGIWHYKIKAAHRWKEVSTGLRSYQEARQKRLRDLQAHAAGALPTDLAKTNFSKTADTWLEGRKKLVAPKTYQTERDRLVPLKAAFGSLRLRDIGIEAITAFQLERLNLVAPRTINMEIEVLRMILRAARLWGPIADEYTPLPRKGTGPGRALSSEEEAKLFKTAASSSRWEIAYHVAVLAAHTTMRSCEIKGLRLGDVDLLQRLIRVRRASTKTDAGCRVIPLSNQASWALAKILERAREIGVSHSEHFILPSFRYRHTKQSDPGRGQSGYDLTKPMKTWRTAWRSLTEKAGLAGLRFHDLRHHCITRLAENGVPEQTLMAIAGHVSKEMLDHYSHIRMKAKRDAIASLDSAHSSIHGVANAEELVN